MKKKSKTLRKKYRSRKQKHTQKGGFYPSVFHGVTNAAILAPLAFRQAYNFWSRRKTRRNNKIIDALL
jgi:hypothetical protein